MEDTKHTINYSHVVEDSGFWTDLKQMKTYFEQMPNLDRHEILIMIENTIKQGYDLYPLGNGYHDVSEYYKD